MDFSELKPGEAQALLKTFVLDIDRSLEKLEARINSFNIFEAVGMTGQEIRHSHFLAYLLTPFENHGLGDAFLKRLLIRTLAESASAELPISPIEIDICDLSDTNVETEKVIDKNRRIDIFLYNKEIKLTVTIENKVYSGEHSEQLKAYQEYVETEFSGYRNIFIFLTRKGDLPEDEDDQQIYNTLGYDVVVHVLDRICHANRSTLDANVITLIEHYMAMLIEHIIGNPEEEVVTLCQTIYDNHQIAMELISQRDALPDALGEISKDCQTIYKKHRAALELVFKYRLDLRMKLSRYIQQRVEEKGGLVTGDWGSDWMAFYLKKWNDIPILTEQLIDEDQKCMLHFAIGAYGDDIHLKLHMKDGLETVREILHDTAVTHHFQGSRKKKTKRWETLAKWELVSKKELLEADGDYDTIVAKFDEAWKHFLYDEDKLRQVYKIINGELQKLLTNNDSKDDNLLA